MPAAPLKKLSHASLQEAAQWYVQLHDHGASDQQRQHWQAWLAASGEHQDAWRYVERVSQRFAPLQGDAGQQAASHALRSSPRGSTRRQALSTLLVLGGASLLGWSAWRAGLPDSLQRLSADLATGTGQTRETVLSDGSRIWLNALSALDVRFSPAQRLLRLHLGEVLIDTAKDPLRPFLVHTEHGQLRALGTRFSVRQEQGRTLLNVFAGAVEVRTARGQVQVIDSGQQVAFDANGLHPQSAATPAREAWRHGVLLADNLPLGQLLAELSRYRPGHLGCDPAVAAMPVMGSFPLRDTDQALALLQAALPIQVETTLPWWVSVGPKRG